MANGTEKAKFGNWDKFLWSYDIKNKRNENKKETNINVNHALDDG